MARILLVEDEPVIAAGVRDDLELEGYEVDPAADGRTAALKALGETYDLILLDIMLPGKDGYTVCREVRAAGITTPIIMLTARGQEFDKVLGLELGADDYVTKPFGRQELLARVKAAIRRGAQVSATTGPGEAIEFGNVKVNFSRCEAFRSGERVELTAKELVLLKKFAANRGKTLTLDEIGRAASRDGRDSDAPEERRRGATRTGDSSRGSGRQSRCRDRGV